LHGTQSSATSIVAGAGSIQIQPEEQKVRKIHRFLAIVAIVFGLYVAGTGTLLQLVDLKTVLSDAPATDPNLEAIREGLDGPPNFQLLVTADYTFPDLPSGFDFDNALNTVVRSERAATGGAPMSFVELRMMDGKPVGQIASQGKLLRFDTATGEVLAGPDTAPAVKLPPQGNQGAFRNQVKGFHRLTVLGNWGQLFFVLVSLTLCVMVVTGLTMYFQLLAARTRLQRKGLYWSAGGGWRTLHRGVAITASAFLVVVVFSGTFEALNSGGTATYRIIHNGLRPGLTADVSSPLQDAELPSMLHTTLTALRSANPGAPIKVLRLRYFAGMPQGIIVTGGEDTRQYAFNAVTGGRARFQGPGYPVTGMAFGWQWDQWFKKIHRGDVIGLTGRWMSLLTGLSLLFLSVSGAILYFDPWKKRRQGRSF
jgi:uncharacterized iron-regulated membrane protein